LKKETKTQAAQKFNDILEDLKILKEKKGKYNKIL